MPPKVPSFGSQEYWDKRFTADSNPFEWLEVPTVLDQYLVDALSATSDANPQLLHIGCGTSLLSYHLRAHVKDPAQIHNLDYSEVAVEIGRKREVDIYKEHIVLGEGRGEKAGHGAILHDAEPEKLASSGGRVEEASEAQQRASLAPEHSYMRWSAADLLDPSSILKACQPSSYSLIVDKSTCDSIACSDDLYVPLPYPISAITQDSAAIAMKTESPEPIHPLHIMAVHLALVAKPKARWICLSYSLDRFPFLSKSPPKVPYGAETGTTAPSTLPAEEEDPDDSDPEYDLDDIPENIIEGGFPNPSLLWKLAGKYPIEAPAAEPPSGHNATATIHRPKIWHFIYVLERTDVKLHIRN